MKGRAQDMGMCNEEDVGLTGPWKTTWALPKATPVHQPLLLCTHYVQAMFTFVVKTPEVTVRWDPDSSHRHAGWWSALWGEEQGRGPEPGRLVVLDKQMEEERSISSEGDTVG